MFFFNAFSQVPEKFNYQGVLRNSTGDLVENTDITVKLSILQGSSTGLVQYSESHNVSTNDYGLFTVQVGAGTLLSGSFTSIDWSNEMYLKTEVANPAGGSLVEMGIIQLISVPYSLFANKANEATNIDNEVLYFTDSDTLFAVKDHNGNIVFAVFTDGAKVYVNEATKGKVGGFAVSGRSPTKLGEEFEYLHVTPDSTRIYVNDTISSKGKVGGFAVSGRSPTKGTSNDYLFVTGDSTRIYVNDTVSTKGKVGGFAVSGRSPTKGVSTNYMEVTRDSTRIYVPEGQSKGKVGGFAVSGRSPTKAGGVSDYFNISGNTTAEKIENESRVMWYPEKSALLAGEVHVGSADSVGQNSIALGYRSIANGDQSQAFGYKSKAYGTYATAIGYEAESDTNSMAVGYKAKASGNDAFAMGSGALAIADKSFAFGSVGIDSLGNVTGNTKATGEYAYAFGLGSVSSGRGAFAMGANDTASGEFATAVGYKTKATSWFSTALGSYTSAIGLYSTAMGNNTTAIGSFCTAMGYNTTSYNYYATAMGNSTTAGGMGSVAMGYETTASALASTAMGRITTASGSSSTAMGYGSTASGSTSTAIGNYANASGSSSIAMGASTNASGNVSSVMGLSTTAQAYGSLVIGRYNIIEGTTTTWTVTEPVFVIGNGTSSGSRANAFTVLKNGNTAIGHNAPTQMLDVNGNARFRSVATLASATTLYVTADGTLTTGASDVRLKENITTLENGLSKVLQLRGVNFTWKSEPQMGNRIGFIAQEVEKILPEMVFTNPVDGYKGVNYAEISAVLVEAVKELKAENDKLKNQLLEMNIRLEKLEK